MMFYDPEMSRVNADYHHESLVRSMQNSSEDFKLLSNAWRKLAQAIRSQLRSVVKQSQPAPIGDIQTNAG